MKVNKLQLITVKIVKKCVRQKAGMAFFFMSGLLCWIISMQATGGLIEEIEHHHTKVLDKI